MKHAKIIINGIETDCEIVAIYADNTVRIEYPVYCNGRYNGFIAETISQDKLIKE